MRLSTKERVIIKETLTQIFGECEIYLFGSRLREDTKGGDIDLFVVPKNKEEHLQKRLLALYRLK